MSGSTSTPGRTHRSASGRSAHGRSPELDTELQEQILTLRNLDYTSFTTVQNALLSSAVLQRLRHTFIDRAEQSQVKDAFRENQGFKALATLLFKLGELSATPLEQKEDEGAFFAILKETLYILSESVKDHAVNKRYVSKYRGEFGWDYIKTSLLTINNKLFEAQNKEHLAAVFYGMLLAIAVDEDSAAEVYVKLQKNASYTKTNNISERNLEEQYERLSKLLGEHVVLQNADAMAVVAELWLRRRKDLSASEASLSVLTTAVPQTLQLLTANQRQNVVGLHTSSLLSLLLPVTFDWGLPQREQELYEQVASELCRYGLGCLEDAVQIYSRAMSSSKAAAFLLDGLRHSRQPASIQFDLSLEGHASCELRSLGKQFPPMHSNGYTLSLWVNFDSFDPHSHTTLFGAYDPSQTCFLLAYLEKDTRNLILQTSIRGTRPSVRFRSIAFESGKWYHICIVHRRPRTTSSSKASLLVDGEFVEQQKLKYPDLPASTGYRDARVQAFLGTPIDLANNAGNQTNPESRWSIASTVLFGEAFSDDLASVFYHLGPRYHGNYQDCLGSFQTYSASAALNVRNESLHPGKEERSDIVAAIRNKASLLISESSIILNISPWAVLDDDDRNNIDESLLIKSLSKSASRTLHYYLGLGVNAIAINGAVPAINDALTQAHGIGLLTGGTVVSVPQALDDASWRIGGGTSVGLSLVNAAGSAEALIQAVQIMFEMVRDNWRNSEAIEKENGYGILALIIRCKLYSFSTGPRTCPPLVLTPETRATVTMNLLKEILDFVGYDAEVPQRSLINNPLAYRTLLVDTDIWRQGDVAVQRLYYGQFGTFSANSQHNKFNGKRLVRMRIVKKWLETIKGQSLQAEILPDFMAAFKALLLQNLSAESLRALALFITYALHKDVKVKVLRAKKSIRSSPRPRTDSQSSQAESGPNILTRSQIGVEFLKLYTELLCQKNDVHIVKKFARTVTNKWVLYLMSEPEPEVVVLAARILARLLVVHGQSYVKKFSEKSGGFYIMRYRLKRWWHLPNLWPICFAIMFDLDIAQLDLDRSFDLFSFLEVFDAGGSAKIATPEVWTVIMGMLQSGLKAIVSSEKAEKAEKQYGKIDSGLATPTPPSRHRLSMSSITSFDVSHKLGQTQTETLNTVIRFLADMHSRSSGFREFAATSDYAQNLLGVLFPVVVGSDVVSAEVELNARDSILSFDATNDMVIRPLQSAAPIVRTSTVDAPRSPRGNRNLRRGSSFVLVTSEASRHQPSSSRLHPSITPLSPVSKAPVMNDSNNIVQSFLEIVVAIFVDQILTRKDFNGLGLFLKTPPAFVEHQTYFESWILRNTLSQLKNTIMLDQKLLSEPKVLTNLARFFIHIGESLYEGWFVGGADAALDFAGSVLEYLQRPDIAQMKSVRLCARAISDIRAVVFRVVLLSLSHVEDTEKLEFLDKLAYWQTVLLSSEDTSTAHLQSICYLLYTSLVSGKLEVREAAANLWRIILVQKPDEASSVMADVNTTEHHMLASGFQKLVELDNDTFLYWLDEHRQELDALFFGTVSRRWDAFVADENDRTEEKSRWRLHKRREKLREWHNQETKVEETITRHESTFALWTLNIHTSEHLKHQRSLQDQQDNAAYAVSSLGHTKRDVERPNGFLAKNIQPKWRLDQTEGRNRMRMRITPDNEGGQQQEYQSKRKVSEAAGLKLNTAMTQLSVASSGNATPQGTSNEPFPDVPQDGDQTFGGPGLDESFELIDEPTVDENEAFEDKNRKVMRSLHRGDQVQQVANISRIAGLEAVEGLLILGKDNVYLIDNFFQRADGEIINIWQASDDERDQYVQMISGREASPRKPLPSSNEHETRTWKWDDVISISKRRFLFRDVALEIFFADGRSYLLTVMTPSIRDNLHGLIIGKSPQYSGPAATIRTEDSWRYETLRSSEDQPQTIGTMFANVFSQGPSIAATRKWMKGEISNFHYLMLVNTLAGRTFNDLTQYPVFPWVLADYTSDELDLTNPKTFRDLSKPMGCQTREREAEYRDRYQSFAEMGDHNAPPFHYGTHYSSAMIVTSYLIRLQPFVKSYLLLQGGNFDHADRMFYSISKAWNSASRINMTDVRELTPEFYYLPEFLENLNQYDFGARQGSEKSIDHVELPPWAKGDPKIFIAKHREALESPYVSQHLHQWIDLVFGYKQKGDAAIEAVNVFHHLSYQGAKDLDAIEDPIERLATIGIIHNFGQTPYQAFQKPHPSREEVHHKYKRLDTAAESLARAPSHLLESGERVASLVFSWKQDRLLCSAAFRLNIPPNFERYMEWGFSDGSVRFYSADSRKLVGHAEHLHVGQLSRAVFADSRTLITSGTDCTVSVWSIVLNGKSIDLPPKACFFGHRQPAGVLAVSRSFGTLLSASADGDIMIWDLNRLEFVRKLDKHVDIECAQINDVTGNIVLCQDSRIFMYTLNGSLLLDQRTGGSTDKILSCAFYEGAGNEWLERDILFTGHAKGVVKVWSRIIRDGRFELELIRQLNHVDSGRDDGGNVRASISCLLPMPQVLYTGDEEGKVVCILLSSNLKLAANARTVRMGLCAETLIDTTAFHWTRKELGIRCSKARHAG